MRNRLIITIWMFAAIFGGGQTEAAARVLGHHGVWDLSCAEAVATPSSSDCLLIFDLGEGPDLRSVSLKRGADGHFVMRMTFVTGIYLPRGVDIIFDGEKKGVLPFQRCLLQDGGCIVEFDAAPIFDRLKVEGAMTIAFSRDANSNTSANVSINGFTEAVAALEALSPLPPAAAPDTPAVVTRGAWKVLCDHETGGVDGRRCNALQSANDPQSGSLVSVVFLKRRDAGLLMHVSVSGDIVIKPGLALLIDGQPQGLVQFDVCSQAGCVVEVQLADIVVSRLKAGRQAAIAYKLRPERAVSIAFALEGFAAAYPDIINGD